MSATDSIARPAGQDLPHAELRAPALELLGAIDQLRARGDALLRQLDQQLDRLQAELASARQAALPPAHPEPSPPVPAGDDPPAARSLLLALQKEFAELDQIPDPEAILERLFAWSAERGLRALLLQDRGRALHAERATGFVNFEGERAAQLRRVIVPLESDGLFAALASEQAVYSGPRPTRGLPVDLVLVMGKRAPLWCLLIPFPYRNRWGRFLYVDASAEGLQSLLFLDPIARYAVMQMRAARQQMHRPADKVRAFKVQTLAERKRKQQLKRGQEERSASAEGKDASAIEELLARKGRAARSATLEAPSPDRFDEAGRLVRPLQAADILARIGNLPSMPQVALRLIGMLDDPDTTIQALQETIGSDQALSVRLLQIANSSLYGSMRECSTIGEAVMRLGFRSIRSWLMATATRAAFVQNHESAPLIGLWRQSLLCARGAHLLAARTQGIDPEAAFLAGLLQNIGLLLIARDHPMVFDELLESIAAEGLPMHLAERRRLGFDHADLGALILQRWGLGEELVDQVASHHQPRALAAPGIPAVIALAEDLVFELDLDPDSPKASPQEKRQLAEVLGLDAAALDAVRAELGRLREERSLFL